MRASKLALARRKKCPYKMGRALLPEFFTPEEMRTCTTVAARGGQQSRPPADPEKLQHLLGKCCILVTVNSHLPSLAIVSGVHEQHDYVLLLFIVTDEVRKAFPGGFEATIMKQKLNQGFIDYRNKNKN